MDSLHTRYCRLSSLHFERSLTAIHYIYQRRQYPPILTRHLAPLASRHHHRLVPRHHPTKTRVCCRQQEASLSTSILSTSSEIKMKHDDACMTRTSASAPGVDSRCRLVIFKMSIHLHRYFYFVLLSCVRPLTGESSLYLHIIIKI